MKARNIILVLTGLSLSFHAVTCRARTWYVARDGSGEFTVIQNAVNAASSGDTIQIGPGQYTEYTSITLPPARVYVELGDQGELTLLGAGAGLTKIGPYSPDPNIDRSNYAIRAGYGISVLTLQGIGVVNVNAVGVSVSEAHITLVACEFADCRRGAVVHGLTNSLVENCTFSGCWNSGIDLAPPTSDLMISGSTFSNCWLGIGLHFEGVQDCVIENCTVTGGFHGIQVDDGATAWIRSCQIRGQTINGLILLDSGDVRIDDCVFELGATPYSYVGAWTLQCWGATVSGSGNTVISPKNCLLLDGMPDFDLHNNHFLRGSEQAWYVYVPAPFNPVHTVDLNGNWWGTDDPDEIAAWIHDDQDDPAIHLHVNFMPFLGGPVAGEEMTWGEVKNLFRGAK